jgi:hypothetical protein
MVTRSTSYPISRRHGLTPWVLERDFALWLCARTVAEDGDDLLSPLWRFRARDE